jgi:hypothetical protein
MKTPDAGFVELIDKLKRDRTEQVVPSTTTPQRIRLTAITEDGQVMPFPAWAKRWSDENIDGRRRV